MPSDRLSVERLPLCLSEEDRVRLSTLVSTDPFARAVMNQLERVVSSAEFARSRTGRSFLCFVVGKTLLGESEHVKETTVAMAVFGEGATFNTAENSKVRVAANDLRTHLKAYAEVEGRDDAIEITLPLHTYVPVILDRRVAVVIGPFQNWHPQGEQGFLCDTIQSELAYRLESAGLRAVRGETTTGHAPPRYLLRGALEAQEGALRITVSLWELGTKQLVLPQSFQGNRDDLIGLVGEVARAVQLALIPSGAALKVPLRRKPPLSKKCR